MTLRLEGRSVSGDRFGAGRERFLFRPAPSFSPDTATATPPAVRSSPPICRSDRA